MDEYTVNHGFDRLQDLLLDMRAGDELRVAEAANRSGLKPEICLAVLKGLTRAGLMSHEAGDLFVRRHLDPISV